MGKIKNLDFIKEISSIDANGKEEMLFLKSLAEKIYRVCSMEDKLNDEYFQSKTFDELLKENNDLYSDILGDNYNTSYGNPDYAVKVLGKENGQVATYIYNRMYEIISLVFQHKTENIDKLLDLFVAVYNYVKVSGCDTAGLKKLIRNYEIEALDFNAEKRVRNYVVETRGLYKEIAEKAGSDLRYLFRYGKYIGKNEIETAKFLADYKDIPKIADTMVKGYVESFERENKDLSKKSTVKLFYYIGQESIMQELVRKFAKHGLEIMISSMENEEPNKQFTYDHRFDMALFFDEDYCNKNCAAIEKIFEKYVKEAGQYSGPACIESFGEKPFLPESKDTVIKLSDEQSDIYQKGTIKIREIFDKYVPSTETSFTIIAFPKPEIGDNFEEIFDATMKINTLDSDKWERIQNGIIQALDKGDYIHVKGKDGNRTDIKVKMHELANPEKETNFENCIATVNIPVGEVFTSPVLKGTNGVLHLEEIYLDNLKYIDLELVFKDGYIDKYSCKNFDNEEKNKEYIKENLLFPNKTLPIGEFAIGTNTLAYVIAQKLNIVDILPILIVEKMGPHFAIGDTCYSFMEDNRVYNQYDGKEIVAKDNEKSILRKTDVSQAYTQCHMDITIPYDSLEFINAIAKDGTITEVIKDGRFVLKEAEELNEFFEEK